MKTDWYCFGLLFSAFFLYKEQPNTAAFTEKQGEKEADGGVGNVCVFVYKTPLPPCCVLSPPWNSVLAAGWMKNKVPRDRACLSTMLVCLCVSTRASVCVFAELTLKPGSRFLKVKGVVGVNEPFLADRQHRNRQ